MKEEYRDVLDILCLVSSFSWIQSKLAKQQVLITFYKIYKTHDFLVFVMWFFFAFAFEESISIPSELKENLIKI